MRWEGRERKNSFGASTSSGAVRKTLLARENQRVWPLSVTLAKDGGEWTAEWIGRIEGHIILINRERNKDRPEHDEEEPGGKGPCNSDGKSWQLKHGQQRAGGGVVKVMGDWRGEKN